MTKCPKCNHNLNLGMQLLEWDELFGSDWDRAAMVNIICPYCHKGVILGDLITYDETEDVKSPMGIVKIPKLIRTKLKCHNKKE